MSAIPRVASAQSEGDACVEVLECLDSLYRYAMISFLRTIGTQRYIIGEKAYAVGDKWKEVAEATKRLCDPPDDLLPYILFVTGKPEFVADSRVHARNDQKLCEKLGIISHYAIPLMTPSMRIGTLQVELDKCTKKPVDECLLLDALAAHLSLTIGRHRLQDRRVVLEEEVMNMTVLVEYASTITGSIHGINHGLGEYCKTHLKNALNNNRLKANRDALGFLNQTEKSVAEWKRLAQAAVLAVQEQMCDHPIVEVETVVKEAIENKISRMKTHHCDFSLTCAATDVRVKVRPSMLVELLSCLLVNSVQSKARHISVEITQRQCLLQPEVSTEPQLCVEITVADDGEGIPLAFQDKIQKFGWTTKSKVGTGIGLTVADLLVRGLGGLLTLRSGGKSAGMERTAFSIMLPRAD